ncbi:MAG: c-type cytochrome, partial [Deltaproteobacteria bacterium]|nr:c-type cytochrome [Deltaproteobacteria bacterium]
IRHVQALSRGEQPAAGDAAAFAAHCEPCHLEGGRRRLRVPTIGQGGWLSPAGLRQLCVQGQGEMPAVVEELSPEQALDLQAYMRTVVTRRAAPGSWPPRPIAAASPAAAERGQALYQASCRACHGQAGEPRLVWPDLREAGYLHSERYLAEIVAHGAGAMPAYPGLEHSRLAEITAYLVALSSEVHQTGPGAGEPPPLYHELCEGCHQEGGRASGYVPDLASAGQDQSTQRLRTVIGEGFGAMGPVTLQPAAVDDLVAFFQRGLSPPAPSPAAIAAAKAAFGSYCGGCHHDDGLAPTQIPGVGDVLGRGASTSYIEDLIDEGLGWMPAIPAAAGVLVPLGEALAQAARNEQPSGAGLAAYDAHCRSCHREPTAGDEEAALVRPTPVTTVGGRLSPAFLHDLVGGLGAMARVDGLADADAALRPYLESVAAAPLRGPTAIPAGGDTGAARAAFDPLCGGCHREQGLAEVHMPRLAQKLRAKIPGTTYVKEFIARSDEFGSMPLLVLSGGERAQIEAYCTARGDGRAASEGARSVFARRCAGCHPESESDAAIVVPHLVPTARRLSARLVRQASLQGVGRMAVATHPDGRAPTEAEIDRVFPQLSWLADQQGKPFAERPLDRARIDRGKSRYTQLCATGACHAEGAVNLAPRQLGGRPFAPLEGLSAVLLEQVTRQGMGVVPGGLGGMPGFG